VDVFLGQCILLGSAKVMLKSGLPYCVVSNLWRIRDSATTCPRFLSAVARNPHTTQQIDIGTTASIRPLYDETLQTFRL